MVVAAENLCKRNALLMPESEMQKLWLSYIRAIVGEQDRRQELPPARVRALAAVLQDLARGTVAGVLRFLTLPVALRQLMQDEEQQDLLVLRHAMQLLLDGIGCNTSLLVSASGITRRGIIDHFSALHRARKGAIVCERGSCRVCGGANGRQATTVGQDGRLICATCRASGEKLP